MKTETRMVVTRGRGNGELLIKQYKRPAVRQMSSGVAMPSMVTVVNNTVTYT